MVVRGASTAGTHSYGGLIAVRFVLGIVEAPFFSRVINIRTWFCQTHADRVFSQAFFVLSCWYTRKELALRTAVLYSGLVLATAFSGLIAAGVFAGLDGARGIAGWRWLFIIEGAGSFTVALLCYACNARLPWIQDWQWPVAFTEEERNFRNRSVSLVIESPSLKLTDRSFYGLKLAAKGL